MRNTLCFVYCMVAGALLVACSATQSTGGVIAPSILDVPVLEGSYVPTPCPPLENNAPRSTLVGCVAYPQGETYQGMSWDNAYVAALRQYVWRLWSGAGNEYWLERAIPGSDCSDRLDLVFWASPTSEEQVALDSRAIDLEEVRIGTIHFFKYDQPMCGDARLWLRARPR